MKGEDSSRMLNDWPGDREFQIEKEGYYDPTEWNTREELRKSEELRTALSFVRHIHGEWKSEQHINEELRVQNIDELTALVNELSATSKNFKQIVEAILNVRH